MNIYIGSRAITCRVCGRKPLIKGMKFLHVDSTINRYGGHKNSQVCAVCLRDASRKLTKKDLAMIRLEMRTRLATKIAGEEKDYDS